MTGVPIKPDRPSRDWILRNARIADHAPLTDIAMLDGRIGELGPDLPLQGVQEWDVAGRAVLPDLVDAHTHLDKTYLPTYNRSGQLLEAIDIWLEIRKARRPADIQAAVRRALRAAVANGATAMRSHVDTIELSDLPALEAILAVREEWRELIDLQIVALGYPGCGREFDQAMQGALEMDSDILVGAAPALTPEPDQCIAAAFRLAERYTRHIDLHVDESEEAQLLTLALIAEQTLAAGMQRCVTAGHCVALAFAGDATAGHVMDKTAEAQIHVITLPSCNLVLMGRGRQPAPRGITRVKELLARGVNVSAASDNVHDPFNPFGGYDLLQIANLCAHVAHLTGEEELYACLDMVTKNPAQALGLEPHGVQPGLPADLVVLDAQSILAAVTHPPLRLATFKRGRLAVRTSVERTWHSAMGHDPVEQTAH